MFNLSFTPRLQIVMKYIAPEGRLKQARSICQTSLSLANVALSKIISLSEN